MVVLLPCNNTMYVFLMTHKISKLCLLATPPHMHVKDLCEQFNQRLIIPLRCHLKWWSIEVKLYTIIYLSEEKRLEKSPKINILCSKM